MPQAARWEVVDHCYLCDMCYMSKCPYVPPHPWNVDFPHLMLRAKAVRNRRQGVPLRDRLLSSTDVVGRIAGIPVVREIVNATTRSRGGRRLLEGALGVHRDAPLPEFHAPLPHARDARREKPALEATPAGGHDAAGSPSSRPATAIATSRTSSRTSSPCSSTTASRSRSPPGALLRHAEARARRPRGGREAQGDEHPGARGDGRHRPRHPRRDPVLRPDVQAGAAAALPGRPGGAGGRRAHLRPVRVPDAAPCRGPAADGLQAAARQGRLPRALPPARAGDRAEDARAARRWCPARSSRRSSAARATTAPTRSSASSARSR